MEKEIKGKLFLGVVVITGIILFIIGIFLIGSKQEMFTSTFRISTVFSNVNGLRKGDYVRFSGVKSGIVSGVTFLNDSMIKVDMKIDKEMQQLIKKDAIASIATEGLVGNKLINIRALWRSRVSVEENDVIRSNPPFDTQDIIEKLVSTNSDAATLAENLAKISLRLNGKKGILETVISDTTARSDFKEIIYTIKTTGRRLAETSGDFEKMIKKINLDEGLAGILLTDTALANELKLTMRNLRISSDYSTKITGHLTKSIQGKNKNSIGMLLNDSSMAQSLRESIINLQQSTEKLNENMNALQHSILLRKYFKEKEKEK